MYCCCTLHTYQHMLCIAAVHTTHTNTCYVLLLYTTHINTCHVLLLYTTHISTHAMYCCCTLQIYQHMLCIAALHLHSYKLKLCIAAVHHTHINTCYVLRMYTTHISVHAMYCCCTLHTYQHILCIVAIVDFTRVHHIIHC